MIQVQFAFAQVHGLRFKGKKTTPENRTQLNLTPEDFMKFKGEFEISFDYKRSRIYRNSGVGLFGYVLRLINEEDKNIDLLSMSSFASGLNLVFGNSSTMASFKFPRGSMDKWINLRLKFNLDEDQLIFYTPDSFYVHNNLGLRETESFKIIFGANNYKHFKNTDVPSMSIRNLKIKEKGKLKHHWLLNEKQGNVAIDRLSSRKAEVINPMWMGNYHEKWQSTFKGEMDGSFKVATDIENGIIYMISATELAAYDTHKNEFRKINYKNKPLFENKRFNAVFNTKEKNITCYLTDEQNYCTLDLESGEWSNFGTNTGLKTNLNHANPIFYPKKNSIYTFGGYGTHKYNNRIRKLNLNNEKWRSLSTDSLVFYPRYLSGITCINDTVFILGGFGSKSGNQLLNPQCYYDLITYSLKDGSLTKKFEVNRRINDMVIGSNMWINSANRNYYALAFSKVKYENKLQLIKGSLDSPDIELVGNTIPFQFLDNASCAQLFYMPGQNQLFAYTSFITESKTQFAIYSIHNPPDKNKEEAFVLESNKTLNYGSILLAIILVAGCMVWLLVRRKPSGETAILTKNKWRSINQEPNHSEGIQNPFYSITLFGGFQVFNKEKQNITGKFSPLLKELFLLILLHTYKNNKGISSERITEILWYDKSEQKANNNLAVNIGRLRSILQEINGFELSKKTGYWKINNENNKVKIDYCDFVSLASKAHKLTKANANRLIEITEAGAFLSNLSYDWLDDFKSEVSEALIDRLVEFASSRMIKKEADFIIHLADSIFTVDPLNEDAMMLKCKAQHIIGKHSYALTTFNKFNKKYETMYGRSYHHKFPDIINEKEKIMEKIDSIT